MNTILSNIKWVQFVKIESVDAQCSNSLEYLGFIQGTTTKVVSKGSFSGPIFVDIRGARIALRHEDAQSIVVSYN